MKKTYLTLFTFLLACNIYSQVNLNEYKYIIVQKQFQFQSEPNQFDLNRIVRFQFERMGFDVIMEGQELPADLKSNFCLALQSEVISKGFLRTKATIFLRNCNGDLVLKSQEGTTKEKDLTQAHRIAIERAFESFKDIQHYFHPKEENTTEDQVVTVENSVNNDSSNNEERTAEIDKSEKSKSSEIPDKEIVNIQNNNEVDKDKEETTEKLNTYFKAEAMENGYVVKDSANGQIRFTLIKTKMPDVYLTSNNNGIVYKNDFGQWIREFEKDGNTLTEILNIKF